MSILLSALWLFLSIAVIVLVPKGVEIGEGKDMTYEVVKK